MRIARLLLGLTCTWALACSPARAARVVHVIPDNPSTFTSADPNDPQYVVALFDKGADAAAIPAAAAAALSRSTIMTDAEGQRFNCSVPGAASELGGAVSLQQQAAAQAAIMTKTPFDLLDSLTGLCLYRQDGLWTYEICHKKHVRQFRQVSLGQPGQQDAFVVSLDGDVAAADDIVHAVMAGDVNRALEELGKLLTGRQLGSDQTKGKEDFICGKYSGDEEQTEALLEDASSSGHYIKYVSHTFGGGADCVLTGAPRTAEVRYTCARDTKENVVLSVKEFPSCNYVVVISTPFLCKHLAFVPAVQDVRLISCVPLDAPAEGGPPPARRQGRDAQDAAAGQGSPAGSVAAGGQPDQRQGQQQQQQQQQAAPRDGGSEEPPGAPGGGAQAAAGAGAKDEL